MFGSEIHIFVKSASYVTFIKMHMPKQAGPVRLRKYALDM